jgi:hypothetical protein
MDLSEFLDGIAAFYTDNPIFAVVLALVLVVFIWRKPKLSFFLLFLALLMAGTLYFILQAASSGSSEKEKLLHKQYRQSEE